MKGYLRVLPVCSVLVIAGIVAWAAPSIDASAGVIVRSATEQPVHQKSRGATHKVRSERLHRTHRRVHYRSPSRGKSIRRRLARARAGRYMYASSALSAVMLSGDRGAMSTLTPSASSLSVREQSATAYEGLSRQTVESTINESDPSVVDVPAGGPPQLAEGQKATGYVSDYGMSVELGGSSGSVGTAGGVKHAVVESVSPLALETGDGKFTPLNLGLREVAGGFQPTLGLAPARLPQHASEGAKLLDTEVSLTPVTEQGTPLEGDGVIDNSTVFYGNTEDAVAATQDLSMFAKPTTAGFEFFSALLSERSPENLYFKVGLPKGATLEESRANEVRVVSAGETLAIIAAPSAQDAEGLPVPVSMSVSSSDTIKVNVSRKTGQYGYPLIVDPEVIDRTFLPYLNPAWVPNHFPGGLFEITEFPGTVEMYPTGAINANEWSAYQYETQGKSKIFEFEAETEERDYITETETLLEVYAPGEKQENWGLLANNSETSRFSAAICAIKTTKCEAFAGR